MKCSVVDCGRFARARGYCMLHYQRWQRHGEPGESTRRYVSHGDVLDRIADKFLVGDDCWEWIGSFHADGYGGLSYRKAYRVVYEVMGGIVPKGKVLHHTCENKSCVRPGHLQILTPGEHQRVHRIGWKKVRA